MNTETKTRTINLIEGSIFTALIKLAFPIIATSFVQVAYGLIDMMWVGRLGSGAVAAVGTVGFFTWLANAFIIIPRTGAEVGVAQAMGRNDRGEIVSQIQHNIQLIIFMSIIYGAGLIIFRYPLIGFYKLGPAISAGARGYMVIISLGMVFFALNPVFTGIFTGAGDSRTPFRVNVVGLVINIILDPIFIFGFGPIPRLETAGAAIATVIAQFVATLSFVHAIRKRPELFSHVRLWKKPDLSKIKQIFSLGLPVAIQSALFTIFSMIIGRIISGWGVLAFAVENVGAQIESISWMTAGGFQSAMSAFVGQNYGANKGERVYRGYFVGLGIISVLGIGATILLIFGARPIFSLFIPEEEAIIIGISYLRIHGLSQLGLAFEILTAGAFIGQGKTGPPAIVGIVFNFLRIPLALILSSTPLGLDGIWWAISISTMLKGSVLMIWHLYFLKKSFGLRSLRLKAL